MQRLRMLRFGILLAMAAGSPLAAQVADRHPFPDDASPEAVVRQARADAGSVGTAGYFLSAFVGAIPVLALANCVARGGVSCGPGLGGAAVVGLTFGFAVRGRPTPAPSTPGPAGADADLDDIYDRAFRARVAERRIGAARNGTLAGIVAGLVLVVIMTPST